MQGKYHSIEYIIFDRIHDRDMVNKKEFKGLVKYVQSLKKVWTELRGKLRIPINKAFRTKNTIFETSFTL